MGSEAPSLSENEEDTQKLDRSISSDEFGISSSSGEQQKQQAAATSDSSSSQQQSCSSSSSAPERNVSTEDPTAIIESLRARLLSERNSSKSAKQQAVQLARKVKDLERQLHEEIQRRKHCEDVIQELLGKMDSAPESSEEQDQQSRKPKWISLRRRRRDSSDGSIEGDALNPSLNDQDSISPGSPSCSPISDTSAAAAAAARRIGRSCRTFKRKEIWELEIDEQVKGSWKKIGADIVELSKLREQESLGTETGWVSRVVEMFESKNEFWASSSPGAVDEDHQDDLHSKISKNKIRNCGESDSVLDDLRDPQEQEEGESVAAKNLVSEGSSSRIDAEVGSINHADETSLQEASILASDDLGSPIKNNVDDSAVPVNSAEAQDSVGSQDSFRISAPIDQEVPRSEEPSKIPAAIVAPRSEEPSKAPDSIEPPTSEEPSRFSEPPRFEEPSRFSEPPRSVEQPKSSSSISDNQEQAPKSIDSNDQIQQNQYPVDRIQQSQYPVDRIQQNQYPVDRIQQSQYPVDQIQQSQYPINRFQHRHSFGNAFNSSDRQDNVQEILRALRIAKQQLAATTTNPIFPADHHQHLQIQPRFILESQNPAYSFDPRFLAPNRF